MICICFEPIRVNILQNHLLVKTESMPLMNLIFFFFLPSSLQNISIPVKMDRELLCASLFMSSQLDAGLNFGRAILTHG